ncbi:hypothetical protein JOM56_009507 [Amanita muscaria]
MSCSASVPFGVFFLPNSNPRVKPAKQILEILRKKAVSIAVVVKLQARVLTGPNRLKLATKLQIDRRRWNRWIDAAIVINLPWDSARISITAASEYRLNNRIVTYSAYNYALIQHNFSCSKAAFKPSRISPPINQITANWDTQTFPGELHCLETLLVFGTTTSYEDLDRVYNKRFLYFFEARTMPLKVATTLMK